MPEKEGSGSAGAPITEKDTGDGTPADPFAKIDIDDLDPAVRAVVEASRQQFATLQVQLESEKKERAIAAKNAREFQSAHDKLLARLQSATGNGPEEPKIDPMVPKIEVMLIKRGVTPEMAKAQAPMMVDMFEAFGQEIRQQVGQEMAPFANAVLHTEAEKAWHSVEQTDQLGALQIEEVRNATWQGVQSLLQSGQGVTDATIRNLRNMHYAEYVEKHGAPVSEGGTARNVPPTPPPMPNIGPPRAWGGAAVLPRPTDPNAPKTALNTDTQSALANTFAKMGGPMPKAFQPTKK